MFVPRHALRFNLVGWRHRRGANKALRLGIYESWPLTVDFMTRVWNYYPYELYSDSSPLYM